MKFILIEFVSPAVASAIGAVVTHVLSLRIADSRAMKVRILARHISLPNGDAYDRGAVVKLDLKEARKLIAKGFAEKVK